MFKVFNLISKVGDIATKNLREWQGTAKGFECERGVFPCEIEAYRFCL